MPGTRTSDSSWNCRRRDAKALAGQPDGRAPLWARVNLRVKEGWVGCGWVKVRGKGQGGGVLEWLRRGPLVSPRAEGEGGRWRAGAGRGWGRVVHVRGRGGIS